MIISNYKAVFFDLDGTLVDSAKDIAMAINLVSAELKLKSVSLQKTESWIGSGVKHLLDCYFQNQKLNPEDSLLKKKVENLFTQAYRTCLGEHSKLYPNVQKVLVQLLSDNKKIACITNKPFEFTDFLMQQHCIRQFFHVVSSGDYAKLKKPDPWSLNYCIEQFKLEPQDCLMVGDSMADVQAAKAAGCDIASVSYGYHSDIKTIQTESNYFINDLIHLL